MAKKPTLRTCTGCGQIRDKKEMIRIIRTPEGSIELDATGKKNGRGAYLCPSQDCLTKAARSRGLERSFKTPVPQAVYEQLSKELNEIEAG